MKLPFNIEFDLDLYIELDLLICGARENQRRRDGSRSGRNARTSSHSASSQRFITAHARSDPHMDRDQKHPLVFRGVQSCNACLISCRVTSCITSRRVNDNEFHSKRGNVVLRRPLKKVKKSHYRNGSEEGKKRKQN